MAVTNILASAQADITAGYAELGATLGTQMTWYAQDPDIPAPNNPLDDSRAAGSFLCYFDRSPQFSAKLASAYGKPEWYVAYDRAGPSIGDYFSDGTDTYFITAQDTLTPSKTVQCNATVSFYRPGPAAATMGASYSSYYEGNTASQGLGQPLAMAWPVSLLAGSRGERALDGLAESGRQPWATVLCPAILGINILTDDQMIDQLGRRWAISSVELSSMGYRMTAILSVA